MKAAGAVLVPPQVSGVEREESHINSIDYH